MRQISYWLSQLLMQLYFADVLFDEDVTKDIIPWYAETVRLFGSFEVEVRFIVILGVIVAIGVVFLIARGFFAELNRKNNTRKTAKKQ